MTVKTTKPIQRIHWKPREAEQAAEIYQEHFTDIYGDDHKTAPRHIHNRVLQRISASINRPFEGVWNRFHHFGATFGASMIGGYGKPAPYALAELAKRREATDRRDLTATFFNDPPPGYSALDRRRHEVAPR